MTSPHAVEREEVMACLDGELPPAREAEVRSHLESCESCRALAGDLTHLSATLGAWQIETPPDRVTAAVRGAIRGAMPAPTPKSWRSWLLATGFARVPRWVLAAAPALVVLLLIAAWPRPQSAPALARPESGGMRPGSGPGGGGGGRGDAGFGRGEGQGQGRQGQGQGQSGAPLNRAMSREMLGSPSAAPVQAPQPIQPELAPNGPMIERTVTIAIVTDQFDDMRATLERLTTTFKGMIGSLDVRGDLPMSRTIRATLRIPADELDSALADIRQLGKVRQESQSSDDIGDAHRDLVVRLANARREETRLLEILSRRTDRLADVLEVEREASRVRGEIERMEAQELSMRNRVSYSTVSIAIDESYRAELQLAELPLGRRLRNALVDGWRSATESVVAAILTILENGPTLAVWLMVLGLPAWAIWRVVLSRRPRPGSDLEMR